MGFVAHSPPNFEAAQKSLGVQPGPVMTQRSATLPLFLQVTGIMNMVGARNWHRVLYDQPVTFLGIRVWRSDDFPRNSKRL